jgi:alkylated DNA nucleotide flippase Atl1
MKKKSWREKLEDGKGLPRVEKMPEKMVSRWGAGTIVIPAPVEVDELMRQVPEGRVTTINHVREALAKRHRATIACPMTTGIFARIAAEAAEEEGGGAPYWRTLKADGELNPKYPGGIARQRARLEAEGHTIKARGGRSFVVNYGMSLAELSG